MSTPKAAAALVAVLALAAGGVAAARSLVSEASATCDQSSSEALLANRIVANSQSYRKDNPAEYTVVRAYLEGGSRPTTSGMTHMGLHLVYLEDTCRAPDITTTLTTTVTTPQTFSGVAVSPDGDDSTCLPDDEAHPCRTLGKAYVLASPGDHIEMWDGTYPAQSVSVSTTNGKPSNTTALTNCNPVLIEPAPGATVVLTGTLELGSWVSVTGPACITVDGRGSMTMTGFVVGYSGSGTQPNHLALKRTHVTAMSWSSGGPAPGGQNAVVYCLDCTDFTVSQNEIGPVCCSADVFGPYIRGPGNPIPTNILIEGNYVHDIGDTCTEMPAYLGTCTGTGYGDGLSATQHVDGIQTYGCVSCTFRRNIIYMQGDSKQSVFFAAGTNGGNLIDLTIDSNFITNACTTACGDTLTFGCNGANGTCSGFVHIDYNTVVGNFAINNTSDTTYQPGSTFRMVGNIFTGRVGSVNNTMCSGVGYWKYSNGTVIPDANMVWRNNLLGVSAPCPGDLSGTPTLVQSGFPGSGPSCGLSPARGGPANGSSACKTATGVPNLDLFGLQPAINGGELTYCPPTDVHGDPRPVGAVCDIGADEAG